MLAALRRHPRPAPPLAAGVPPPSVPDLQPPPAVPREDTRPAPIGYAVALLGADGRYLGTTHTTALDPGEAMREAIACNRSRAAAGRYVAVEIRHLGERP